MSRQADDEAADVADCPSGGAPVLPDLEQKLLVAFQNATEPLRAEIASMLGIGFDGSLGQASSAHGKRKYDVDTDEESPLKRARTSVTSPGPRCIDFREIRSARGKFDCLVQVKFSELIGSVTTRLDGYAVRVFLDAGDAEDMQFSGSPRIGLHFKYPGSDGHVVARVNWQMDARVDDRWIVQRLEYVLVQDAPQNRGVNHKKVLSDCPGDALDRLMCITLELTSGASYPGGFWNRKITSSAMQATRTRLNAIFSAKKKYVLRIWFVVPRHNSDLDRKCLAIIHHLFSQRKEPLSSVQDAHGLRYAELRETTSPVFYAAHAALSEGVPEHGSRREVESEEVIAKTEPMDENAVAIHQSVEAAMPAPKS